MPKKLNIYFMSVKLVTKKYSLVIISDFPCGVPMSAPLKIFPKLVRAINNFLTQT